PLTDCTRLVDLGCGTGAAGAAWALACPTPVHLSAVDRNGWAVEEARWTYRQLEVAGRVTRGDLTRARLGDGPQRGLLAAYVVNELDPEARGTLLERLVQARMMGARALVVEPIARRVSPWWPEWESAWLAAGGRADEWRFPALIPERQRALGRAGGL